MFPKLALIILAFGAIGCTMLALRQQQIEAANRMTRLHERLAEADRSLWKIRAEIARRCSPSRLRELQRNTGEAWESLVREPQRQSHADAYAVTEDDDEQAEYGG